MTTQKIGLLIANLGTPDEPTTDAVKRYLKQFLNDARVIDLPKWRWQPLLNTKSRQALSSNLDRKRLSAFSHLSPAAASATNLF